MLSKMADQANFSTMLSRLSATSCALGGHLSYSPGSSRRFTRMQGRDRVFVMIVMLARLLASQSPDSSQIIFETV
jgi:hypothetical protein